MGPLGEVKGAAHHALKNALRIGRQGEIRVRTIEGQHYRIAGLNLLTAIIIYWNTLHRGLCVTSPLENHGDGEGPLLAPGLWRDWRERRSPANRIQSRLIQHRRTRA